MQSPRRPISNRSLPTACVPSAPDEPNAYSLGDCGVFRLGPGHPGGRPGDISHSEPRDENAWRRTGFSGSVIGWRNHENHRVSNLDRESWSWSKAKHWEDESPSVSIQSPTFDAAMIRRLLFKSSNIHTKKGGEDRTKKRNKRRLFDFFKRILC